MNRFLINILDFEFDLKNPGTTKIKTAIRKIENEKSNPSIKKFFQKAKSFWNS